MQRFTSPLSPRAVVIAIALIVLSTGVASCGGESGSKPMITEPSELVGGAAIEYRSGAPYEPRQIETRQGQLMFVALASDTPGRVRLEGDDSIKQRVEPGEVSSVVINAAEVGEFDLLLQHKGGTTVLATVEVKR